MTDVFEAAQCGAYESALKAAAERWGIVKPQDQARWLAQLSVESAGFTKTVESMAYRPETLLRVANGRNGLCTLTQAQQIVAGGQEAIAEALYGGSWGTKNLGNISPGDGWKYRGHGLIQITGRSNHYEASMGCYGDTRLLEAPDLLTLVNGAAEAAAWFWYNKKLNGVEDVVAVTKRINGGNEGLVARIAMTKRLLGVLE